ncbi:MAG: IPT/TIG domain-containing protein [Methylobacter sp.]
MINCKLVVCNKTTVRRIGLYLACFFLLVAEPAYAQVSVLMHHNDNGRTGANLEETLLNTTNVNVNGFGKLFSYPVDADIYTQPLYVPGVTIPGKGTHNVIYVATQNNSVYAFDADTNTGNNTQPLWQVNFNNPGLGITPVPASEVTDPAPWAGNIRQPGPIGIMGTPVIDPSTGTMYLVARTKESETYAQRLHALDITSGAEKFGGPTIIQATVPGAGNGNINGVVSFNAKIQNQRPGLVLDHGVVYIAWSSHDDLGDYNGWVIGYDAATLQQIGVFNDTPDGWGGGIWQSGQPPVVDADGNLYLMTGNGTFDASVGGKDVGNSFVKLKARTLELLDWFTPHDVEYLNQEDEDLNSGGVLMIPNTSLISGGGKQGRLFLLNKDNLGHYNTDDSQVVQAFQATSGHIHGSPVYYVSPTLGALTYVWGETNFLKGYSFDGSVFNPNPVTQSTFPAPPGMPGGFLSISANGVQPETGILWATMPYDRDAENTVVNGVLRAFDASDLSVELWNSRIDSIRDDLGNFAKYVPPTIANGKVYVATFSGQLVVYGLTPPPPSGIQFMQQAYGIPQEATAVVPVDYKSNQSSGDLNIVVVGWKDTASSVQSVTDSNGNSYNLAVGPTKGIGLTQSIYYANNIKGGKNTITVQFDLPVSGSDVRILEYYGVDTVNPVDVVAGANGNGTQSISGTVTTTADNERLFAANTTASRTTQAGFPFIAREISPNGNITQDAIANAAGTYNATASLFLGDEWVMQMVALKPQAQAQANQLTVTNVSPAYGSVNGGKTVTIVGTNFAPGATVSFGDAAATVLNLDNSSITAMIPGYTAGKVDVTVSNPNMQSVTLPGGFTYTTPAQRYRRRH